MVEREICGVGEGEEVPRSKLGLAVTTSSHARSEGVEMFTLTWFPICWKMLELGIIVGFAVVVVS